MKTCRLPKRDFVRSVNQPSSGLLTASHSLPINRAFPASDGRSAGSVQFYQACMQSSPPHCRGRQCHRKFCVRARSLLIIADMIVNSYMNCSRMGYRSALAAAWVNNGAESRESQRWPQDRFRQGVAGSLPRGDGSQLKCASAAHGPGAAVLRGQPGNPHRFQM